MSSPETSSLPRSFFQALPDGEVLTASHWGLFYAKTKDGRLVAVRPFEGDRAPSPNLSSLVEHPYSSARIQTPMVRRGYLEKVSASRAGRGADEYVPVSWDKALDLAAGELRRIYETYGPSAVWGRSYGWKSTGSVNNAIALMQRLLSLLGGWVETGNSYSTAAISTILPYAVGGKLFKPTAWPVIMEKTELGPQLVLLTALALAGTETTKPLLG